MSSASASFEYPSSALLPSWPANFRLPEIQRWWCWSLALLIHLACLGISIGPSTTMLPMVLQASLKIPAREAAPSQPLPPQTEARSHLAPRAMAMAPAPRSATATNRDVGDETVTAPSSPAPAAETAPVHSEARFDAAYLHNPKPDYPLFSRRQLETGTVLLKVRVSAEGKPLEIALKQSSGFARLDQAAQETVARWRFVPARRGDEAIESWVSVPVKFSIE